MPEPTVIITHPKYLEDYPTASAECPARIKAILSALEELPHQTPEPAAEEDILRVHTRAHYEEIKRFAVYEVAMLSAGGAISAGDIGLTGQPAFAVIRPPGHHASPNDAWGFCFFNNMAITIERMLALGRIKSAMILDIDLHFGDGTDNFFHGSKDVIVINIEERIAAAFLDSVSMALAKTPYDIIAVSAGFDNYIKDWGSTLATQDFYKIGKMVFEAALKNCSGRRFAILEGGYYLKDLGTNVRAFIDGMEGK